MEKINFTQEQIAVIDLLGNTLKKAIEAGLIEGFTIPSNSNQDVLLTADELAEYLKISKKSVYYRSAKNSKNPFPFKIYRIGGCRQGRLRFKKTDVDEALAKGIL